MVSSKKFNELSAQVIAAHEILGTLISALVARDRGLVRSLVSLLESRPIEPYSELPEVENLIKETADWLKEILVNPPKIH